MENETRKISENIIEYKQNQIDSALLDKKEAVRCADNLILLADELLEFAGKSEEAGIIYRVSTILQRDF